MRLLRIILVVIFGLCLTVKAQSAEAHSLGGPAYSSGFHQVSSPAKAGTTLVAVASSQDDDGCKDGCCTSMMSCCAAALPPTVEMSFQQETSSIVVLSHAPLSQGPPFTFLRPPRFAA